MNRSVDIADLMETSGVKFGTSGARGLVHAMTDEVCFAYTAAFLQALAQRGDFRSDTPVAIAGDRRSSTPRIMAAVARACRDAGHDVIDCGRLPAPALALYGITHALPSIMVTGSHIPEDRNGIKFNKPTGEISKDDEAQIRAQVVALPAIFDAQGNLTPPEPLGTTSDAAAEAFLDRFLAAFGRDLLTGMRIGVYGHSAVGRDLLSAVLEQLGAHVTKLGYSDTFVSVDTEAIRPADVALAQQWTARGDFDALVSTDGDSDRPLVSDERGRWLRGDIVGLLCARWLGARTVVTPVSSNTAIERCGSFERIIRTRIGSPYVIEAMTRARDAGAQRVVGFEANGGFLQATPLPCAAGTLAPLPTRDAFIVIISVLAAAKQRGCPMSALRADLPQRYTASNRLESFPSATSRAHIDRLLQGGVSAMQATFAQLGPITHVDTTDGLRMTSDSSEILHLRPSGNAPELRCYVEADDEARAEAVLRDALGVLETWR